MPIFYFLLVFIFSRPAMSSEFILHDAVLSDGGVSPRTEAQKAATTEMSKVMKLTGVDPYSAIASTNLDEGNTWYRLYNDMTIHAVDVSTKKYLGGWSLGAGDRWGPQEYIETGVRSLFAIVNAPNEDYAIEMSMLEPESNGLGCLAKHTLRYGDINSDGQHELILMPRFEEPGIRNNKQDFMVFSPVKKAVIFLARIAREDVGKTENVTSEENANFPQINSAVTEAGRIPAVRAYAKLYFSDFNKDGVADIVAWRKRYESRKLNDAVKGFALAKELLTHYQLINGEYKRQTTDGAAIKGWLAAKGLTWQKGYPSQSECVGEEGKPIPEMHDPLLNDPEVLAAGVIATSAPVTQASFDCGKASTPVEKQICSSDVLKQQDVQLATAYKAARAKADASGQRTLKDSQVAFIKARQAKCKTAECIQAETQRRLQELASDGAGQRRGR